MTIFSLSGPDLAREIAQPAPVTVFQAPRLADVLAQITALPGKDQAELLRAFGAALKPETKRIGGQSFRNAEEFFAAFNKARDAARSVAGEGWYLDPSVSLKARVPGAWVALKGEQGTWRSPRDVNMPQARFWPGGVLPVGPEYAEFGPLAKATPPKERRALAMRERFPTMARHVYDFELEPTVEELEEAA